MDESSPKSVGILAGHMDGITFIDSRGDGRHLISNSKDQSIKLWDVRVFSGEKAAEKSLKAVHEQTWDYRWQEVPRKCKFRYINFRELVKKLYILCCVSIAFATNIFSYGGSELTPLHVA